MTPRAPSFGPSQVLRLSSDPARVVMALFVFSNFVYALATLDDVKSGLPVLVAAVLVNAACVLLVLEKPDPFPWLWTSAILATVLASTLLVAFQLPDAGPPGRASWHLGSNTWLLFFLAMRGRTGASWAGFGLMAGGTFAWTSAVGRSPVDGLLLLDTHASILLVASLFSLNLRRTSRQINALETNSVASAVESAEAATSAQIRQQRVIELRASAAPLLERIANEGPPDDPAERRHYATAEALLRDSVRGRSLVTPRIAAAATSARERGVDVTLLDDRGRALDSGDAMVRLGDAVVTALDEARDGAVTVRLAPEARRAAVSIVSTGAHHAARIELDADGVVISEA